MNQSSQRNCCGGQIHNKGYSTEPEHIDLRPFNLSPAKRQEQNEKLNEEFRAVRMRTEARQDKKRRQAVLLPLFKLLEHLDHSDPRNADIIENIKTQLALLAQDPKQVEVKRDIQDMITAASSKAPVALTGRICKPSAFQIADTPGSVGDVSRDLSPRASTSRSCSRPSSAANIEVEDETELDGMRGSSCEEIFDYILRVIKSIIPNHTREEIEQIESQPAEPVATHNHPADQLCRPSCWAYDAAQLARNHNYVAESELSQRNSAPGKPFHPSAYLPSHSVTTSMRVPINFTSV